MVWVALLLGYAIGYGLGAYVTYKVLKNEEHDEPTT